MTSWKRDDVKKEEVKIEPYFYIGDSLRKTRFQRLHGKRFASPQDFNDFCKIIASRTK